MARSRTNQFGTAAAMGCLAVALMASCAGSEPRGPELGSPEALAEELCDALESGATSEDLRRLASPDRGAVAADINQLLAAAPVEGATCVVRTEFAGFSWIDVIEDSEPRTLVTTYTTRPSNGHWLVDFGEDTNPPPDEPHTRIEESESSRGR